MKLKFNWIVMRTKSNQGKIGKKKLRNKINMWSAHMQVFASYFKLVFSQFVSNLRSIQSIW